MNGDLHSQFWFGQVSTFGKLALERSYNEKLDISKPIPSNPVSGD